jgi:hypothetical protein
MSFEQLKHVSRICNGEGNHFLFVEEWDTKRQYLAVYNYDIPKLVEEYKSSKEEPYELNPKITLVDQAPRLRLASSCEAASNCLYSMAEIAAQFGNKVSKGDLPASFNKLRKKYEDGAFRKLGLVNWVQDFQWYKKVRELRTEWAHFSTVFIGKEPILVVRSHRRNSDREEFKGKVEINISDLVDWINKAIITIDNFGNFLLVKYILPSLALERKFISPVYDKNGFPIIKADHRFEVETITVEEHLRRGGIIIPR